MAGSLANLLIRYSTIKDIENFGGLTIINNKPDLNWSTQFNSKLCNKTS